VVVSSVRTESYKEMYLLGNDCLQEMYRKNQQNDQDNPPNCRTDGDKVRIIMHVRRMRSRVILATHLHRGSKI
jgi:hypothetical protein